jgi:ABC-type microcin C transport system permease subunit YejB
VDVGAIDASAIGREAAERARLTRDAIEVPAGDYPVVLGTLYLFTLMALVVKLISDLLYVLVDPRMQFAAVSR